MQLRIIYCGNEILTLPAEPSTRVYDIKSFIANSLGLSPNDIILTVNGAYLENTRSLQEYSIKEFGSLQLHLPINCQKIVSVRVIISPEEVYSIPIRTDATVELFKSEILKRAPASSFDPQNAFLVYSHYILEDSRTLEEYGITDNAGIIVAHTLDGDKSAPTEPYDYCDDFKNCSISTSRPRTINVHFLIESGEPFTVQVDPSKPLKSVSKNVEQKTGIPAEYQGFTISGVQFDSKKTPEELGIEDGESLYLNDLRVREIYPTRNRNGDMEVIFDYRGGQIRLIVPKDCTVKEAQRTIQAHHRFKGQEVELYFKNNRLNPRKTLQEYGITSESVIHVDAQFL
ncbi:hypothetical protein Aperf_G00000104027 [Anoplocephala perfoliata]